MSRLKINPKLDLVKVILIVLVVGFGGLSGFFYYQTTRWEQAFEIYESSYSSLRSAYIVLQNRTSSLEMYYNELQDMYSSLRSEYSDLQNRYSSMERDKLSLQREYDEILGLEKIMILEKDKTLNLAARGNITLVYDTLFAGYIEVNFTSSTDVYFWIGSSLTQDLYYARYPSFPNTALNGTFIVPVCAKVYIYVSNPNESIEATVTLTIKYVY